MQTVKSTSLEAFIAVLKSLHIYQNQEIYKVACPFHGDVNPSLQINLPKKYFYCYGCGAHGSTLDLLRLSHPTYSPFRIMEELNSILEEEGRGVIGGGKELSTLSSTESDNSFVENKLTYSQGIQLAKNFYFTLPTTNWYKFSVEQYDQSEEENYFRIKHYLLKRGFTPRILMKYGAKYTYKEDYPVVFPIYDNNVFRGYVMRTDDPFVEANRKYMYNKGFKRERTPAGQYKTSTLILVEGFLDRLKANELGLNNVVAILGWKVTGTQLSKFKKAGVKKILCALDNDEAGNKGYHYLKLIEKTNNFSVERIHYPKGTKDFGELTKGTQITERILNQIRKAGGS